MIERRVASMAQHYECALWYMRYGTSRFDLFPTEGEAAARAISIEENDEGSVEGVQFADGRVIDIEHWNAYRAARAVTMAHWKQSLEEATRRMTRVVIDPFSGRPIAIEHDEPDWVGGAV